MVGNMTLLLLFMQYAFEHTVNKNAVLTANTLYLYVGKQVMLWLTS